MFDFYEKRKLRKIFFSFPIIGGIFLLGIALSFSVYDRYIVSKEMQQKLDDRYAELERLEERALLLESKVEYLSDERGLEEELRNRFDVAKEGEQVVVLVDSKRNQRATVSESLEDGSREDEKGFWDFIFFWRE